MCRSATCIGFYSNFTSPRYFPAGYLYSSCSRTDSHRHCLVLLQRAELLKESEIFPFLFFFFKAPRFTFLFFFFSLLLWVQCLQLQHRLFECLIDDGAFGWLIDRQDVNHSLNKLILSLTDRYFKLRDDLTAAQPLKNHKQSPE